MSDKKLPTVTIINCGGMFGIPADAPIYGNTVSAPSAEIEKQLLERNPLVNDMPVNLKWRDFKPNGNFVIGVEFSPTQYNNLMHEIEATYNETDGVVIIMDLDAIVPTASAVSYALHGLKKPVIFTGAVLPLSHTRTDAAQNLIESIEAASRLSQCTTPFAEVGIETQARLIRAVEANCVTTQGFDAIQTTTESKSSPQLLGMEKEARGVLAHYGGEKFYDLHIVNKGIIKEPQFQNEPLHVQEFNPGLNIIKLEESDFVLFESRGGRFVYSEFMKTADAVIIQDTKIKQDHEFVEAVNSAIGPETVVFYVNQKPAPDQRWAWSGENMNYQQARVKLEYVLSQAQEPQLRKQLLEANLRGERGAEIQNESEIIEEFERQQHIEEPIERAIKKFR